MKKVPDEIKQLEEKIANVRSNEDLVRRESRDSEVSRAAKAGFRVGTELLSGVLVGAAVGYVLDGLFGLKPWLLVVFMFFGGAAGVVNVYRFAKSEEKRRKE
ncbi:MAG: AtpZ/AtpI family protein [Alphaproteobacteria bacterium]|nr:AtpZ/AtpI family protein [Alphaproteobacteria bacterium]MBQ7284890.1 AtpZ/AtpI family protein [Alphaproteobacteria bacterium]